MVRLFVFLANDPGGREVIFPIYKSVVDRGDLAEIFFTGVSTGLYSDYVTSGSVVIRRIEHLLSSNQILMLITGTSLPVGTELRAIELCKERGITSIAVLDYWSNYSKRFEIAERYIWPDYLFVMDEVAKQEALESGIPSEIVEVVGLPSMDKVVRLRLKENSPKNGICFLSQPLSMLYGDNMGYSERTVIPDIIKAADYLCLDLKIKFHPRETDYIREKYGYYSTVEGIEDIAANYKYVIGMNSMAMLQVAILRNEKLLCYEPNLIGEDYCICNKLGMTKRIGSYGELITCLKNGDNARRKRLDHCLWIDGKSTERCVRRIMEISGEYQNV